VARRHMRAAMEAGREADRTEGAPEETAGAGAAREEWRRRRGQGGKADKRVTAKGVTQDGTARGAGGEAARTRAGGLHQVGAYAQIERKRDTPVEWEAGDVKRSRAAAVEQGRRAGRKAV
jgi:hypothetical protein